MSLYKTFNIEYSHSSFLNPENTLLISISSYVETTSVCHLITSVVTPSTAYDHPPSFPTPLSPNDALPPPGHASLSEEVTTWDSLPK